MQEVSKDGQREGGDSTDSIGKPLSRRHQKRRFILGNSIDGR